MGAPEQYCVSGWQYLNHTRKCYSLFKSVQTWTSALSMCRSVHKTGDLGSILDIITNSFISYLIANVDWAGNHFTKYAWIGAYKCGQKWCWSDGSPWSFSNWA